MELEYKPSLIFRLDLLDIQNGCFHHFPVWRFFWNLLIKKDPANHVNPVELSGGQG